MDRSVTGGASAPGLPAVSLTTRLAQYWADVRLDALPDEVRDLAKLHILDTLAASVYGAVAPVSLAAQRVYAHEDRDAGAVSSGATVWGTTRSATAGGAALCNGTSAHAWELDDFNGCGHSGAVVVPAAMAASQERGASGSTLLLAVVCGYDVASRVLDGAGGYRAHNALGWHSTGTCGSYGAAAAAAKAFGFTSAAMVGALGIAGTFTGGTWAFLADGADTKRLHPGKAAETGVCAAQLAQAGMSGPSYALDAPWGGFLNTYGSASNPEAVVADLGQDFHIVRSGIKAYACCRNIHGAVDSLLAISERTQFDAADVERIDVHATPLDRYQLGSQFVRNTLDAQFSIPYSLAVTLVYGDASLAQFESIKATDDRVATLMKRIFVLDDQEESAGQPHQVDVHLRDQSVHVQATRYPIGAPENRVLAARVVQKARELLSARLGEAAAERVIEMVLELEGLPHVRQLAAALAPGQAS